MSDLFDFFKENESKLFEAPPAQAWKKLESRLDKRRRERRKIRFLQIGVVSIILLLLLLAAFLGWYFTKIAAH
ncbi:MAG: hypothetical protein IPL65_03870 [Lewinellaceae bacterium]|nr:hypothetical protein [Lewinellaceae bacterium]